jgi:hypothetical protein
VKTEGARHEDDRHQAAPSARSPGFRRRVEHLASWCTVTMTINLDAAVRGEMSQSTVEWDPELPPRSAMTKACWRQYRAGRDALYGQVADILGGAVLVADI